MGWLGSYFLRQERLAIDDKLIKLASVQTGLNELTKHINCEDEKLVYLQKIFKLVKQSEILQNGLVVRPDPMNHPLFSLEYDRSKQTVIKQRNTHNNF